MQTAHAIIIAGGIVAGAVIYAASGYGFAKEAPYAAAVREQLRDPDSAKFRNVAKDRGTDHWCGDVNARNGMGGYAGWQPFSATKTSNGWLVSLDKDVVEAVCG